MVAYQGQKKKSITTVTASQYSDIEKIWGHKKKERGIKLLTGELIFPERVSIILESGIRKV